MFKKILFSVVLTSLAACGTTPASSTDEERKVPTSLLTQCQQVPPPDRETYLNSTYEEREGMFTESFAAMQKKITQCNNQLLGIKEWDSYRPTPKP